ncbi:hypothetical protein D0839_10970 [Bordetella avium]|uniref:Uncharacterized protein n=1 Tax=Bordetella avium (strain 197N) TaxID=360910 RepID=Q2KWJ7_BORA1|nr:hypothetical protein D0849_09580 [Bordetella avium]RIQ68578.1 hypothetical protein D0839_10970 [Bordetella avium]CAJ50272.1 hypothetical protein BAV2661A [Bordetella avium 197N]
MPRANARAPDVADEGFHVEGSNTLAHRHKARFKRLAASIVKLADTGQSPAASSCQKRLSRSRG